MTSYSICHSRSIHVVPMAAFPSFFLFFCPRHMSYGILVPWPGIKPVTRAVKYGVLTNEQPRTSSFLKNGWIIFHYIRWDFFIHLSTDGPLGCLQVLAVLSNTTGNMGLQASFQVNVFISFHFLFQVNVSLIFWVNVQKWNCWIIR